MHLSVDLAPRMNDLGNRVMTNATSRMRGNQRVGLAGAEGEVI